ncbi:hypothetical protein, partial [Corallococcus sicarius]|uniref:hypothetical protein n=1 Tax=Corallococcus sicarius TaxID=2316726 RepID=UPI0011C44B49
MLRNRSRIDAVSSFFEGWSMITGLMNTLKGSIKSKSGKYLSAKGYGARVLRKNKIHHGSNAGVVDLDIFVKGKPSEIPFDVAPNYRLNLICPHPVP